MAGRAFDVASHRGTVARMVRTVHGAEIAALGVDVEDVIADVMLRLVRAQRSPGSRYDARRGRSPASYVYMMVRTAGANAMRPHRRARQLEHGVAEVTQASPAHEEGAELGPALDRLLGALDLAEEREMATHLAAGCTLLEVRTRMGLDQDTADELRTRVRALLQAAREEG